MQEAGHFKKNWPERPPWPCPICQGDNWTWTAPRDEGPKGRTPPWWSRSRTDGLPRRFPPHKFPLFPPEITEWKPQVVIEMEGHRYLVFDSPFLFGTDVHPKDNSTKSLWLAPNLPFYLASQLWTGVPFIHSFLTMPETSTPLLDRDILAQMKIHVPLKGWCLWWRQINSDVWEDNGKIDRAQGPLCHCTNTS
jgi:hypothetical protein